MYSERHPIRTGIFVSVGSGLILAGVIWLTGFLPLLWGVVKATTLWVVALLLFKIPIPVWLFIPLMVATVPTVVLVASRFRKPRGPIYLDYKEDEFSSVIWRWSYMSNGKIDHVWCFCPADDTMLVFKLPRYVNTAPTIECETCGTVYIRYDGSQENLISAIKRQIDRKIRSGEWRKVVAREAGAAVHPDD